MTPSLRAVKALLRPLYYAITGKGRPTFTRNLRHMRRYDVGDWTYGAPSVREWGGGASLSIGRFCSIAGGVCIFLGGNHRQDWASQYPFNNAFPEIAADGYEFETSKGSVFIGNDVWIGHESLILSGVRIGNGAVVAARSVVTRDVPAYAVVAGNPARVIRFRFDEETIGALQEIAWWDWPMDQIRNALPVMLSTDVERFVRDYRKGCRR